MSSAVRNAFVLGAGLGTRLRNLTARKPKPLIPICQKPLITFAFDQLLRNGVERLVVNTHHCNGSYDEEFPEPNYRGTPLHFRHEPNLLDTGGGIKNVQDLLSDAPFVVYNGDILSDLPIRGAIEDHFAKGNEVTLVLRSKDGPLQIAWDEATGAIVDVAGRLNTGQPLTYLFTGIYVVNPSFFARIPARKKISVIPIFLEMIERGARLGGFVVDEGHWWDLGTREQYLAVHQFFSNPSAALRIPQTADWPQWIHPSARIAPSATLTGATVVGAGASVGEDVVLENCVLWRGAEIHDGSHLTNCVVSDRESVYGRHAHSDF